MASFHSYDAGVAAFFSAMSTDGSSNDDHSADENLWLYDDGGASMDWLLVLERGRCNVCGPKGPR